MNGTVTKRRGSTLEDPIRRPEILPIVDLSPVVEVGGCLARPENGLVP